MIIAKFSFQIELQYISENTYEIAVMHEIIKLGDVEISLKLLFTFCYFIL